MDREKEAVLFVLNEGIRKRYRKNIKAMVFVYVTLMTALFCMDGA